MNLALSLIAAILAGCAGGPIATEEPWLLCVRTAHSLECVAKVDGETQRISIPDRGVEEQKGGT